MRPKASAPASAAARASARLVMPKMDAALRAKTKGISHNQGADYHPERKEPRVAYRSAQLPDERDGDHKMPERQPIRAISEERIFVVGVMQGFADRQEPFGRAGR